MKVVKKLHVNQAETKAWRDKKIKEKTLRSDT
jgi:hypothetical protein